MRAIQIFRMVNDVDETTAIEQFRLPYVYQPFYRNLY